MKRIHALVLTISVLLFALLPAEAQRNSAETHLVLPGETLGLIAQRYGVNVYELATLNGINNAHFIYSWQQLALPSGAAPAVNLTDAVGRHIVQRGETLASIAKSYDIDLFELQALNDLWSWLIYPGDELALPVEGREKDTITAADAEAEETLPLAEITSEITHTVRFGETLGTIAHSYGVSLVDLQELNDIWTWLIFPGQQVLIPAGGAAPVETPDDTISEASIATVEPEPVTSPDTHTVARGDTLFSIAQKYDVAVDLLMIANGITDPRFLHAGLILRVRNLESVAPPQSAGTAIAPATNAIRETYTVLPGEYLSTIGNKLGMSWLAIAAVNGITNPDTVYAGAVLQIPTQAEAARYGPVVPVHLDPGAHIGVGREIVVVLSTQRAYAYLNGVLQRSAIISSGLPDTPTVKGDFKVTRKLPLRHMVGPGYDLPNVPWVSYFFAGYAIHGTYWHNNFGTPMSHGCVNMTTADAKWFYDFAPVGTPVHVRY